MTQQQLDKRVSTLQYINTALLTLILGFAMMIFTTVSNVKKTQIDQGASIIMIKTIQEHNTIQIDNVDDRVSTLEINYIQEIKTWVDLNYVRRSQSANN